MRFHFLIKALFIFAIRTYFLFTYLDRALGSVDLAILGLSTFFFDYLWHLACEALLGIEILFEVPDNDATVSTTTGNDRGNVAPS
jgi:hypothetical protein